MQKAHSIKRIPTSRRAGASQCAGFTYLAVLFLVAMTGIALSVVGEMWQTAQRREKEAELLFIGGEFRRAFAKYNTAAPGYPRRLEELLKDPRFPDGRRYLRRIYRDPMTGRAEWGLLKSAGDTIIGVYSLSEDEPLKKKGFSLADSGFEGKTKYSEWVFFPRAGQGAQGAAPTGTGATQAGVAAPQPGSAQAGVAAPQVGPAQTGLAAPPLGAQQAGTSAPQPASPQFGITPPTGATQSITGK
jgi:type II secretory pathway pseudopilin PulG